MSSGLLYRQRFRSDRKHHSRSGARIKNIEVHQLTSPTSPVNKKAAVGSGLKFREETPKKGNNSVRQARLTIY